MFGEKMEGIDWQRRKGETEMQEGPNSEGTLGRSMGRLWSGEVNPIQTYGLALPPIS